MTKISHSRFMHKGWLGGWWCPIWVSDYHHDCNVKPRLWGYLTFDVTSWYYANFSEVFPILIKENI